MLINPAEVAINEANASTEQEVLRVENTYWAEMARDLEALENDERFKRVIMKGYFQDKAINGASLLAISAMRANRAEIMEELIAISHLQDYFITIKGLGVIPEESDEDGEE